MDPKTLLHPNTKIFLNFIDFLESKSIPYVIVGSNVKELPYEVDNDIDFIIEEDSFKDIEHLVKQFSDLHELNWVQMIQHESKAKYFVLQQVVGDQLISSKLDFCSTYIRDARFFLSATEMLSEKVQKVGKDDLGVFYIPAANKEFIYYLLKKVDKGEIEEDHFQHLYEKWTEAREAAEGELQKFFTPQNIASIAKAMDAKDFALFKAAIKRFQKDLNNHLSFSLRYLFLDLLTKIKRIRQPSGLSIAFLGADGSGKTTIINKVQRDYEAFRYTSYFHLSPKLIYKGGQEASASDPHAQKKRSFLFSTAKLGILFIEYALGWLLKIQPLLIRSNLVIFDRYYHDILIDPQRYRYGGAKWIAKLVGFLIPKPDLILLLDAPPEILQERKQEVSLAESTKARNEYVNFMKTCKRGVIINSHQPINKVEIEAQEAIMRVMKEKQMKYYS